MDANPIRAGGDVKRRRGTAIVETERGILLTAMGRGGFLLPGGGADRGETRFRAAIRELEEETGLQAYEAKVLFQHDSYHHRHTVVLVKASGTPSPTKEISKIAYYTPETGDALDISRGTRDILDKYYEWKSSAGH